MGKTENTYICTCTCTYHFVNKSLNKYIHSYSYCRAESQSRITHKPLIPPSLNWKLSYFVIQDRGKFIMFLTSV